MRLRPRKITNRSYTTDLDERRRRHPRIYPAHAPQILYRIYRHLKSPYRPALSGPTPTMIGVFLEGTSYTEFCIMRVISRDGRIGYLKAACSELDRVGGPEPEPDRSQGQDLYQGRAKPKTTTDTDKTDAHCDDAHEDDRPGDHRIRG